MTEQEQKQFTFNKVAEHLLKQGERSRYAATCTYKQVIASGSIMRCAVGVLIPDDRYSVDMEGKGIGTVLEEFGAHVLIANACSDPLFLGKLQYIHDQLQTHDWPEHLAAFATQHGLTFGEQ